MQLQNITVYDYTLPDSFLLDPASDIRYHVWQPENVCVVLGRSNKPEDSLVYDNILKDNIRVYKRPSGGESVVLTPKMIAFSVKLPYNKLQSPHHYFEIINKALIGKFTDLGINNISTKGISDLSIDNKKILGSSMYLDKRDFFYHAVLNISEDSSIFSRYLKHPSKEPDYRNSRSHEEFVTSLSGEGYQLNYEVISSSVGDVLSSL
jgi:lipoate-protein ligase A